MRWSSRSWSGVRVVMSRGMLDRLCLGNLWCFHEIAGQAVSGDIENAYFDAAQHKTLACRNEHFKKCNIQVFIINVFTYNLMTTMQTISGCIQGETGVYPMSSSLYGNKYLKNENLAIRNEYIKIRNTKSLRINSIP